MNKTSRRELARWAATELANGQAARKIAKHLVACLTESNRLSQFDFLLADINWELEQRKQLATSKVTSATPLSEQLKKALAQQIKQVTKADEVLIENNIDKSVIGGIRVETASHVWDNTVAQKLSALREVY
jgi:F-type H+-transporting ATPase subunit delta